jgi:hypothetical protein
MDFCIRTTSKDVSTCRNLAIDLAHLPAYPPDMRPRRMISIALIPPTVMNGWEELENFIARTPNVSLTVTSEREMNTVIISICRYQNCLLCPQDLEIVRTWLRGYIPDGYARTFR